MRLSLKLFLFIIPLIILPLATLGGLAYYVSSKQAFDQATATIKSETRQSVQQISTVMSQVEATLSLFSQSSILKSYIHLDIQESQSLFTLLQGPLLEEFGNFSNAYPEYYEFRLINSHSLKNDEHLDVIYNRYQTLYGNNPSRNETQNIQNSHSPELESQWRKSVLDLSLSSQKKLISFIYDPRIEKHSLIGIHPIKSENNREVASYLVISVETDGLLQSLKRPGNPDNKVFLVDTDNKVALGNGVSNFKGIEIIETAYAGMYQSVIEGQEYWLHKQSLPYDYKIFSLLPSQLIDLQIQSITSTTILISLLCIGLTPILLVALINRIVIQPFEELLHGHEVAASGKLNIRLPENRKDEIGTLFSAFNNMVYELRLMQRNLELHRDQLEQKIQLSTQQLRESNNKLDQSRQEAEQANAMKSHFLANMSHEMRTPLTAIIGFSEHAMSPNSAPAERKSAMHTVVRNANHLLNLINDVLDITKIEAGKINVEQETLALGEVLYDVDTLVAEQAHNKNVQFIRDYQYPLPKHIISDDTRLRQILINLLNNAVKFTDKGHVKLKVYHKPDTHQMYFEVTDTGIGLTEEQIKRLFKPFEQADISTTRKYGGTGLGLSICKFLAERLGGGISVVSTLGEGSTFTAWIDCGETPNNETINNISHESTDTELSKQDENSTQDFTIEDIQNLTGTVLLAEDNKDNQALIQLLIKRTQIDLTVVENGQQAVEHALIEEYDLILMDMQMPIMGGLEATKLLRASGSDIPIVALTANFMAEEREQQKSAGCNRTLAKPIDKDTFYSTLIGFLKIEANKESDKDIESELNDDPAYQAIVQQFKDRLEETLSGLDKAWKQKDWDNLASLSHSLKGSAGMFGFPDITDKAAQLEQAARKKDEAESSPTLDALKALCESVQ